MAFALEEGSEALEGEEGGVGGAGGGAIALPARQVELHQPGGAEQEGAQGHGDPAQEVRPHGAEQVFAQGQVEHGEDAPGDEDAVMREEEGGGEGGQGGDEGWGAGLLLVPIDQDQQEDHQQDGAQQLGVAPPEQGVGGEDVDQPRDGCAEQTGQAVFGEGADQGGAGQGDQAHEQCAGDDQQQAWGDAAQPAQGGQQAVVAEVVGEAERRGVGAVIPGDLPAFQDQVCDQGVVHAVAAHAGQQAAVEEQVEGGDQQAEAQHGDFAQAVFSCEPGADRCAAAIELEQGEQEYAAEEQPGELGIQGQVEQLQPDEQDDPGAQGQAKGQDHPQG